MFAPFTDCTQDQIDRLVGEYPLAWVVTRSFNAALLPLLAEHGEDGGIASLLGHCGRRNLIVEDLRADPSALVLIKGPDGYVSNRIVSEPDWGPTWNYAAVRFLVDIEFVDNETASAVDHLLDHMDGPADQRWTPDELGDRYRGMIERIIAFRAHVRDVQPTLKLGQDESPAIFDEIVARHSNRDLAAWMEALACE